MRYYTWMEKNQDHQTYGKPYALFRVEVSIDRIMTDWWNPEIDEWEHHPGLINITELDRTNSYHEVDGKDIESIKDIISKGWSVKQS